MLRAMEKNKAEMRVENAGQGWWGGQFEMT